MSVVGLNVRVMNIWSPLVVEMRTLMATNANNVFRQLQK